MSKNNNKETMPIITMPEALEIVCEQLKEFGAVARNGRVEFPFGNLSIYVQSGWKNTRPAYLEAWSANAWGRGLALTSKQRTWRLERGVPLKPVVDELKKLGGRYLNEMVKIDAMIEDLKEREIPFHDGHDSYGRRHIRIGRAFKEGEHDRRLDYYMGGNAHLSWTHTLPVDPYDVISINKIMADSKDGRQLDIRQGLHFANCSWDNLHPDNVVEITSLLGFNNRLNHVKSPVRNYSEDE